MQEITVQDLERIALASHEDITPIEGIITTLRFYEQALNVSFKKRVKELRRVSQGNVILTADLGCGDSSAAYDMNQFQGVKAFGIDSALYLPESALPKERLIKANLNCMPEVPDNSFHYMISYNALSYRNTAALLEIFRVLRPGGIADLDIQEWAKTGDIRNLPLTRRLTLVGIFSGFSGSFEQYTQCLADMQKGARKSEVIREVYFTRFEMRKPVENQ